MAEPPAACVSKLEFLKSELNDQLLRFKRRRKRDKRKAFTLQMATVTLSATISVLLGLRNLAGLDTLFANIALALGALITVLAAANAFFSHRDLWILRTQTVRDLEHLSLEIRYYESSLNGNAPDCSAVDSYFELFNAAIKRDSEDWNRLRAASPSAADTGP